MSGHPLHNLLEPGAEPYDEQVSIAISLKRIADVLAAKLVELPLRNGGIAHIRPPQVSNVSVNGQHAGFAFVQMIGDSEQAGFTIALSVAETMEKLGL